MTQRPTFLMAAILVLLVTISCDRNTSPFVPGEQPEQPDLSRIFPAPENPDPHQGATTGGAMGESIAQQSARKGSAPAGPGITGEVILAGTAPAGATLFIIARQSGRSGGPPLAVLRVPAPTFPNSFEIGPANVMIPTMRFEGAIDLTARLDTDGNAMTKAPGDLLGSAPAGLGPGATGVVIELGTNR